MFLCLGRFALRTNGLRGRRRRDSPGAVGYTRGGQLAASCADVLPRGRCASQCQCPAPSSRRLETDDRVLAQVAIVVFDVTSAQSYEIMKGWVDELKSLGPAGIRILIAANKSDRTDRREVGRLAHCGVEAADGISWQVSALEAQQYAAEVNALV
eukprot:COSAG05_NODE_1924_length_3830_cov_1.901903_3_plen_155_part_00